MTTTETPSAGSVGHMRAAPVESPNSGWAIPARGDVGSLPACRLRRVTEYIQQNLDKDLTLAELAAVVYMSPYHFARLFKYSTGVPPHRFVVRQRIAHARACLATPELSIAEISLRVGFRTPSHFTTVFRRVLGITPGAYRTAALRDDRPGREGG
jgi:AraC family transcriptional regulator